MKKVEIFKYLGSVVSRDGSCEEDVKKRSGEGFRQDG